MASVRTQRRLPRKRAVRFAIPLVAVWVFCFALGIYFLRDNQPIAILIGLGVFCAFGALVIGGATLNQASGSLEQAFVKDVGQILAGLLFQGSFDVQPDKSFLPVDRLSSLGGINLPDNSKYRYGLQGAWNGTRFHAVHALFSNGNSSNLTEPHPDSGRGHHAVYFSGLIVKLAMPREMPTIVVCARGTIFDGLKRRPDSAGMGQIAIDNDAFSDHYEMWASNEKAVTVEVTSTFVDAFMAIHETYSRYDGALSAAFDQSDFYLTIWRAENITKPGQQNAAELLLPKGKSVDSYARDVSFAYDEFSIPCRVVETMGGFLSK